jgi:hypothetical protein
MREAFQIAFPELGDSQEPNEELSHSQQGAAVWQSAKGRRMIDLKAHNPSTPAPDGWQWHATNDNLAFWPVCV